MQRQVNWPPLTGAPSAASFHDIVLLAQGTFVATSRIAAAEHKPPQPLPSAIRWATTAIDKDPVLRHAKAARLAVWPTAQTLSMRAASLGRLGSLYQTLLHTRIGPRLLYHLVVLLNRETAVFYRFNGFSLRLLRETLFVVLRRGLHLLRVVLLNLYYVVQGSARLLQSRVIDIGPSGSRPRHPR